jgi:hypothetical protein
MTGSVIETGTHIAVVRGADGVRFSASASSDAELAAQLVTYIRERCDDVLWPADAGEVRRLIDEHRENDAIAAYFANVGQRWDEERLDWRTMSRNDEPRPRR